MNVSPIRSRWQEVSGFHHNPSEGLWSSAGYCQQRSRGFFFSSSLEQGAVTGCVRGGSIFLDKHLENRTLI